MIPNNLLGLALSVVGRLEVGLQRAVALGYTPSGRAAPVYAAAETITGYVQPANTELVQQLGLDMSRRYAMLYSDVVPPVQSVDRDRAGDRVTYGGEVYEAITTNDWFDQNGWSGTLLVKVSDA